MSRSTRKKPVPPGPWTGDRTGGIDGVGPHYPKRGIKNKGREEI